MGRSEGCDLQLDDPRTSNLHASLRWTGHRWVLRDLGSRNGVFVDGRPVEGPVAIDEGSGIGFGAPGGDWVLVDGGAPVAFAEAVDGSVSVAGSAATLGLPDAAAELVSLSRTSQGWVAEQGAELVPVADREVVFAGGRWRVHLPPPAMDTTLAADAQVHLPEVQLRFYVSQDQEHIEIEVIHAQGSARVPHYAANELLLVLAYARLEDPEGPEIERGWVYFDDLMSRFRMAPDSPKDQNRMRQWIHQCRRRFERLDLIDGERIVERRSGTRQVRLGVSRVELTGSDR